MFERFFRRPSIADLIEWEKNIERIKTKKRENNIYNIDDIDELSGFDSNPTQLSVIHQYRYQNNNDTLTSLLSHSKKPIILSYDNNNSNNNNNGDTKTKRNNLIRHFKLFDLVLFGISSTVGSGIYVLSGTAGKSYAGGSIIISLFIGLIVNGGVSICFAEFASRIPIIGGNYMYTYITNGELIGFLNGWTGFIMGAIVPSINIIAVMGYFKNFLEIIFGTENIDNSIWLGLNIYPNNDSIQINFGALFLVWILGFIALLNVKIGSSLINIITVFNISILLLCAFAGMFIMNVDYWFNPCNYTEWNECPKDVNNSFFPYGINGTMSGAAIAAWALNGTWHVVYVSQETINPTKNIPKSIYLALSIVFIVFLLVTIGISGMVPFQSFTEDGSIANAFGLYNETIIQTIAALGASTTMIILSLSNIIAVARKIWRLSIDGLICNCFQYIGPKSKIPTMGVIYFIITGHVLYILLMYDILW